MAETIKCDSQLIITVPFFSKAVHIWEALEGVIPADYVLIKVESIDERWRFVFVPKKDGV